MKKTLDAAEMGRSFFFVCFGVRVGRKEYSDCAVIGLEDLVKRCEMEGLRPSELFVFIVLSLRGTVAGGGAAESK